MVELEGQEILKLVADGRVLYPPRSNRLLLPQFRHVRLDVNCDVDRAFYLLIKGLFQTHRYLVCSRYIQVRVD